ncbi:hypothetical protein [Desulforhopalus sp. IMCC35007]|uniref:hypothetical protein n=1 Tax=Desulforhopalus sp. IMCC35007 TaxID=2569543 RepID=UPI0010AE83EC|nr:hypothetical protein [Desulforhopalus sp. IMCC35007]TKB06402.1 hypothetical protein FCL48_21305 [Desulforhopalus sp. IMCC35007]
MYSSLNKSVSYEALLHFIETFEKSYDVRSNSSEPQLANTSTVEGMIQVANDLLLGSATATAHHLF